jgi:hypothetical protein
MPFPNSYVPSVSFKNAAGAGFPHEFIAFRRAEDGTERIYLSFTKCAERAAIPIPSQDRGGGSQHFSWRRV